MKMEACPNVVRVFHHACNFGEQALRQRRLFVRTVLLVKSNEQSLTSMSLQPHSTLKLNRLP